MCLRKINVCIVGVKLSLQGVCVCLYINESILNIISLEIPQCIINERFPTLPEDDTAFFRNVGK